MTNDFFTRFANELSGAKEAGEKTIPSTGQPAAIDAPKSAGASVSASPVVVQQAPQGNQIAVLAAAISATAAAVAVLAALYMVQLAR